MSARIFISLGSNIEPERYIKAALDELSRHFNHLLCSSVFESESVGFAGCNFLNMVVAADTELSIGEVVAVFKQIEQAHGRIASAKKFSARSLDLDLLLYNDVISQDPIELPRAEILTNAFVLWPLAEIAPELIHQGVGKSYQSLWDEYDKTRQKLWPIPFTCPQMA
ncbi:2-amino-4-hydroxy-6-hydroxymethyldihydropteridine diphosphokinase [Shewanella sp. VB17]|uniref:2-amino-4-hydroxy-6- hydroxymethyldihydropteridine diphosphokinase n=1 Tax=Shewanella sp. VB17 TaxID=2739432 RepID=UPI0015650155|nr:2-amino-4-hydroxy-6-hydroxymethyldihydropteridine diphosphokinase [Shewanella sp. VB17]NRD72930.1 2-amino-4-hydroxy-6-hydroxymethyldihydropteridine diphosphokinase [Shewanella sp. VB17]